MDDVEIKTEIKEEPDNQPEEISFAHQELFISEDIKNEHISYEPLCVKTKDSPYFDEIKLEFDEEEEKNKSNGEHEQTNNFRKYFGTGDEKLPFLYQMWKGF